MNLLWYSVDVNKNYSYLGGIRNDASDKTFPQARRHSLLPAIYGRASLSRYGFCPAEAGDTGPVFGNGISKPVDVPAAGRNRQRWNRQWCGAFRRKYSTPRPLRLQRLQCCSGYAGASGSPAYDRDSRSANRRKCGNLLPDLYRSVQPMYQKCKRW